jgi:hypothetical protein
VRLLLELGVPAAPSVSIWGATIFTGLFVVLCSGPSYQLVQGVLEPLIDAAPLPPGIKSLLIATGRVARNLLASALAIRGMQVTGLQRVLE